MCVFPELFLPLFVYTGNLSADVLEATCVNEFTAALGDPVIVHFKRFIEESETKGKHRGILYWPIQGFI